METFFEGYSEKILCCKWAMCEQYDIMNFSFRVGVNTENPNEIGLFYLYNGNLWKRIKSYSWSSIDSTGNDFVPFLIKKDITDFLVKKHSKPVVDNKFKKENDFYKKEILSILKNRDSATITITEVSRYLGITYQKACAILKRMELDETIYRDKTITGLIYFTLAE